MASLSARKLIYTKLFNRWRFNLHRLPFRCESTAATATATAVPSFTPTPTEPNFLTNKQFLWEADMIQFWETLNFNKHHIDIFINLGNGKYIDPKLFSDPKTDINEFATYSLEQCSHLRSPQKAQRYLQNVQKLFPNMILNKALYYNPYIVTLTLPTIEKRKCDLIDLIATHLSHETYPELSSKNTGITNNDKLNNEYLRKSEIIELIDWDKFFENVSVFLTMDFKHIIRQIHMLRKLFCVNYKNAMGLSQIEFIELFEIYPNILKLDYLQFMSKFRFLMEFASVGILQQKRYLVGDDIDFTMIGNEEKFCSELSFTSYENMLSDYRVCEGYKLTLQSLVSMSWIFNHSWLRLARLKYWNYNPELRKKYTIPEIVKMRATQFVNVADHCWKQYCYKTKRRYQHNLSLEANWKDKGNVDYDDSYMDWEEFLKHELRAHLDVVIEWNKGNVEDTKALLKKDKAKLRAPFKKHDEALLDGNDAETQVMEQQNKSASPKYFTLSEKQQRSEYLQRMKKLEQFHGRLCRTVYSANYGDLKRFLRSQQDFGFCYPLKYNLLATQQHTSDDEQELERNSD